MNHDDEISDASTTPLPADTETLLTEVAARVIARVPADAFLDWFGTEAPTLAPDFDDWLRAHGGGSLDRGFGLALWNRLPRPEARLAPRPLPDAGRNDDCPCGSGTKYKRCCLATAPPLETLARLPLLLHVLEALPGEALDDVDLTGADPETLFATLDMLGDEGDGERVVRLVAPVFERGAGTNARREERLPRQAPVLLELLLHHWPDGFEGPRLAALVRRLVRHRDEELASTATIAHVYRTLVTDDTAGARAELQSGLRRFPGHPGLEEIEVDLLNAEGRIEEACAFATAFVDGLRRADPDDPALDDLAESLLARASWVDPETVLERAEAEDDVLHRLLILLEETPPAPVAGSHAPIGPARELVLEPTAALVAVEADWRARFEIDPVASEESGGTGESAESVEPGESDESAESDESDDRMTRVVAFLDDEPLALSSFHVLDELAGGAGGWDGEPWRDALDVRILERGEMLLYRHVSREAGFETPEGQPDWDAMVWDTAPRVSSTHAVNLAPLRLLSELADWHRNEGPSSQSRLATLSRALRQLDRPPPRG